jgi:hypothetical protein
VVHLLPAAGTKASACEDELADLTGAELVAHLSNSYLRADFEAVARILVARDRRNAKFEADLTATLTDLDVASAHGGDAAVVKAKLGDACEEVDALREKYRALLDAFLPPWHKVEEMAPMAATAPYVVHQEEHRIEKVKEGDGEGIEVIDLSNDEEEMAAGVYEEEDEDEEEDTELLSQRIKRLKGGELESGKGDVHAQSNTLAPTPPRASAQQRISSRMLEPWPLHPRTSLPIYPAWSSWPTFPTLTLEPTSRRSLASLSCRTAGTPSSRWT